MKTERRRDLFFILYISAIIIMAVIYFTVPERMSFLENQLKWWGQMLDIIRGGG
ncbi:MAG: hypothetical protein GXP46_09565 [Deferribacteres bacterium]|nr:hypothetical protein [Deferribacteres bacterium]